MENVEILEKIGKDHEREYYRGKDWSFVLSLEMIQTFVSRGGVRLWLL